MSTLDANQVLAQWEADEAAARAHLQAPGVATRAALAGRSGLQVFEAIRAGDLPPPPIGEGAGIVAVDFGPGRFVFQGRPQARFLNPMGTVHGGWIATILDSAVGCAVHTALPPDTAYTTAELKVSYVRALTLEVPIVRAEAQVINAGRKLAFAEARLVGPDGRLYAHATTTCLVMGG